MSGQIFKTKKTGNYTTVSNEFINDPGLSAKAKGILLYLLSKPNDWTTRTEDVVAHMTDGVDSIKAGLRELQNSGYMLRRKIHGERGRFVGWETLVFESPIPKVENPPVGESGGKSRVSPKVENPRMENPRMENPRMENPRMENPPLLNTDSLLKTELLKTKEECISPSSAPQQPHPDPRCASAPTFESELIFGVEPAEPSSSINPPSSKVKAGSSTTQEEPDRDKSSAAAKKSSPKKKRTPAADVYAAMSDESKEVYGKMWDWYRGLCAARGCNPGCKSDGAAAWVEARIMEEPGKLERFRKGCALYAKSSPVGIPYINRFILGSERHETPYWEAAIENAAPVPQKSDFAPTAQQSSRPSHPAYRIVEAPPEEIERMRQRRAAEMRERGISEEQIYAEVYR